MLDGLGKMLEGLGKVSNGFEKVSNSLCKAKAFQKHITIRGQIILMKNLNKKIYI